MNKVVDTEIASSIFFEIRDFIMKMTLEHGSLNMATGFNALIVDYLAVADDFTAKLPALIAGHKARVAATENVKDAAVFAGAPTV